MLFDALGNSVYDQVFERSGSLSFQEFDACGNLVLTEFDATLFDAFGNSA
jgi:hypothetical protein